jgi:predicted dehydrogenase
MSGPLRVAPLHVGLVGCGNVALNFHVPAYQASLNRYEIVGLADRRGLLGLTRAGA